MTEQQGFDLAQFRLDTYNQMIQHASAFQIIRKQEGSITAEECTSIIQGYNHIQTELTQADNSFCCEDCGQGSPYLFSNDDGVCSWCCAGRSDELKKIDDEENDDGEECQHLDFTDNLTGATCNDCGEEEAVLEYDDKLKHFGEGYQPTQEEIKAVLQEIEDSKTAQTLAGDFINTLDVSTQEKVFYALTAQLLSPDEINDAMNSRLCDLTDTIPSTIEELTSQNDGDFDLENMMFKANVEGLIEGIHILELLQGWVEIDCPACSHGIQFEQDGSSVLASCDECLVGATLDVVIL